MKTGLYARIVFGAAAVLFGVIELMWHDADTWQNLQHIWSLPFGTVIGGCLMAGQIAGGIGVVYPRTARLASVVLCVVYLCFSLACVADIVAATTSTTDTAGASSCSFPSSAAQSPCTVRPRQMLPGR